AAGWPRRAGGAPAAGCRGGGGGFLGFWVRRIGGFGPVPSGSAVAARPAVSGRPAGGGPAMGPCAARRRAAHGNAAGGAAARRGGAGSAPDLALDVPLRELVGPVAELLTPLHGVLDRVPEVHSTPHPAAGALPDELGPGAVVQ